MSHGREERLEKTNTEENQRETKKSASTRKSRRIFEERRML